jgi:hypothetical protein
VAVTATIIADAQVAAIGTAIYMASERSGAATLYCAKDTQLPAIDRSGMLHLWPVCFQHISHFQMHFHLALGVYKVSIGLKAIVKTGLAK